MTPQFVADQLFGFLEDAHGAESLPALDALFYRLIKSWGFERWSAMPISAPKGATLRPFEILLGRPSRDWSVRYRERGYYRHDAVINYIAKRNEAVWWSKFRQERRLSKQEQMLFDESREHGIGEGLTGSVRLADGSVWGCALTGRDASPAPFIADASRYAAERYIETALRLLQKSEPGFRGAAITQGQAEIVELLARGHTVREAAVALDIRPSTAYNQIADAKRRAMVKTTAELVHKTLETSRISSVEKIVYKPV